jgi:hypothetical protein
MPHMHAQDNMGVESISAEMTFSYENAHERTHFEAGHDIDLP